jgi:hypothetical protein
MKFPRLKQHWATRSTLAALALLSSPLAMAGPTQILFLGNSYTFGRVDPVMSYNSANVHDLTAGFNAISATGSNPWEPHPWGGIAGIFKQFTTEAGLDYDVSISARNAASLRGHFLNTANAAWNLRGNVASKPWDVVVLQEQSDASLPLGSGKNANPAQFRAYADKFEKFIHNGAAQSYTETAMYGSLAACQATGSSTTTCNTVRNIAANPNANPNAKIYLTETWARPDMVYAHLVTSPDPASPTGSPIPDAPLTQATLYYATLAAMTEDLHDSIYGEANANGHFAGVIGVGDAFQLALDQHLAKSAGFYDAKGVFSIAATGDPMNLWWDDYLHASKYGSYLDALVQFGTITGLDPRSLGLGEIAARDLAIAPADAVALQRIAAQQLNFAVPEPASLATFALGLAVIGFARKRRRVGAVGARKRAGG